MQFFTKPLRILPFLVPAFCATAQSELTLVKDINPSSDSIASQPSVYAGAATLGKNIFFNADDGTHGFELWTSDLTPSGTFMLKDIFPGTGSGTYQADGFFTLATAKHVYFPGLVNDFPSDQLWRTDGTTAGTLQLSAYPDTSRISIWQPSVCNGILYYFTVDRFSRTILNTATDSLAETRVLKDVGTGMQCDCSGAYYYFTVITKDRVMQLWRTNGTEAGTVLLINGLSGIQSPFSPLGTVGGEFYFIVNHDSLPGTLYEKFNNQIWKTDGTPAGTQFVFSFDDNRGHYGRVSVIDGKMYFTRFKVTEQIGALWTSDGTAGGTYEIAEYFNAFAAGWKAWNGKIYYLLEHGGIDPHSFERELWVAGSEPKLIKNFGENKFYDSQPDVFWTVFDGKLIIGANTPTQGNELWASDGTPEGTAVYSDVRPGNASSFPTLLFTTTDGTYFTAHDTNGKTQLWKLVGGDCRVRQITEGTVSINSITLFNDKFAIRGNDVRIGSELYSYATSSYPSDCVVTGIEPAVLVLSLYPNPASRRLTIESDKSFPWAVVDSHGQQVLSGQHGGAKQEIALTALPAGIYLFRASVNNSIETRRLSVVSE